MTFAFQKENSRLKKAVDFYPTRQTATYTLQELYALIKALLASIPIWQRNSSWTLEKRVKLLNYQLFGKAPVSPISANIAKKTQSVQQIEFVTRKQFPSDAELQNTISIIDGQQRLTTNFLLFEENDNTYENVVLDLIRQKIRIIDQNEKKSTDIPIKLIFDINSKEKLKSYLKKSNLYDESYDVLSDVRRKFQNYTYTLHLATDMSEKEQIEWFTILNKAGHKLSQLQTTFANIDSKSNIYNIDIYKDYIEPFTLILSNHKYEHLFGMLNTKVSYPFAALNPAYEVLCKNKVHVNSYAPFASDAKKTIINTIAKNEPQTFLNMMNITLMTLDATLKFIKDNQLSDYILRIDHILYIMGYFIFKNSAHFEADSNDINYLSDWVKKVKFNDQNKERRLIFSQLIKPLFDK